MNPLTSFEELDFRIEMEMREAEIEEGIREADDPRPVRRHRKVDLEAAADAGFDTHEDYRGYN